jgi:23S rRNA (guanine745-N1)-methyltransferase
MNPRLTEILICPHCGGELRENGGALICSGGHTANIARQGYVSLLGPHSGTHTADSAAMVAARERFLAGGHFEPIADAVAAEVRAAIGHDDVPAAEPLLLDLGSGTGYYLAAGLASDDRVVGLGIDNSKYAARRAARCHPRAGAIVADIWDGLPVRTGAATVVLNVFAPRNGEEIRRILAPGGTVIVVTPTEQHLNELRRPFGMISIDPEKQSRLDRSLGPLTGRRESRLVEWRMDLGPEAVADLVAMGPSAGRLEPSAFQAALRRLPDPVPVSGAVRVTTAAA